MIASFAAPTPTSYAARAGLEAVNALTFEVDPSVGAGQFELQHSHPLSRLDRIVRPRARGGAATGTSFKYRSIRGCKFLSVDRRAGKAPSQAASSILLFFFSWILLRSVTLAACGTGILDSRFRLYNAVACQNKFPFITIIEQEPHLLL